MVDIEINDLASLGVIRDVESYQLPPEAFSFGDNIRFINEGVEKIGGEEQVFGTPGVAPHYALPISSASANFWLYVSLTKAYVYDGSTHTNVTRQTAAVDVDYTASNTRDWQGTLLGGVPILNNGVDDPQFWASLATATKLAKLTNWPANTKAKVIRAYGPYLLAMNVTKAGTVYPHMVKWAHPADPGAVPSSWDETDPTKDTGEKDLPDVNQGTIQDGLPLRGDFFVYKSGSVWRMKTIGGQFIFSFDTLMETQGILAARCVTVTGDGTRHVFATQDDIVVHNGNAVESVLDERYRKYLFNAIDSTNFANCFIYTDPLRNEVVFCYPESGQTNPNRAVVWNYKVGKKGCISERAINYRNASGGVIEGGSSETWASAVGTWETDITPWNQSTRRKIVGCATDVTKFLQLDTGTQIDGVDFTGTLQRTGLGVVGRKRNGEWIENFHAQKFMTRLWIKASGGPINVRIGFAETPDGTITWQPSQSFDPTTQNYLDWTASGKAFAIEFSSATFFRLQGYKMEGDVISEF